MNSVELFTGAGGLALGTHIAGFRHRGLVEWDDDACETLRRNVKARALPDIHDWKVHQADVRMLKFDIFGNKGGVDLVAGGAPCQPFSLGGKHQAQEDARNMIPDFVRAVRELQPRAFIMENVKGLMRESFRNYFEYIRLQLINPDLVIKKDETWREHHYRLEKLETKGNKSLKYNVVVELLNAADYGIPQTRQRVFFVGFREDTELAWHFPKPTHSRAALMHAQWVTSTYWEKHRMPRPKEVPAYAVRWTKGKAEPLPPGIAWKTIRDAFDGLPDPRDERKAASIPNHRFIPGARSYYGHTGSPYDLPAKTLKAGVHGVPGGENMLALPDGSVRYFTVREAARLQTFPDTWHFEGSWGETMRQLGNAVPVELAAVVARSVLEELRGQGSH
ncbi:DNA cytosine methyltransferase [Stigmatella erecta]|uniref:DNA (cytosine-5-)-methyltransferase n=1 Tax=Stigmatella erecta TaxID=83460 RepID=A0A1I0ISJ5_9BACT|nr:DNA cytosine methyltransferase [Stigmatella erecta]SET99951.1 DNA (cytosine-5)-methyltransferase 1 [Stigmatella erecta]